ncbi:MAG: sugar phosphate nucleotidyltransferase [Patescibacteria group bacterium]|jgi:mannose-1-phosphate guanylyltransferase
MKIVIRAGGSGTRLWPSSRENNPKQFQALVGENTLIRDTVNRVKPLLKNKEDFFISVNRKMAVRLKREIKELPTKNIILEPAGRNTGPAICLECCVLARRFGEEAIIASLPSDDYISDAAAFREMLAAAENFLKKYPGYIVTPGAKPNSPDTGYSYIKIGEKLDGSRKTKIFEVGGWIEKPELNRCKNLIKSGKYFYHAGMYIWKLKTVLDLFRKFQPKMYSACQKLAAGGSGESYAKLEKISIESAITNKASKIAVAVSEKFIWSDLGKWQIISKMIPGDKNGNVTKGENILIDTKNCLVYGPKDKLVAAVGLKDIVVVLTEDALLVCPKDRAGEVKKIVDELGKRGLKKYL